MEIKLQNTLTGNKDIFHPIKNGEVTMYHCGPTVYDRQHIGNLSMFVFTDVLRRTFEYFNYKINQVINITDFGHLSSDADSGEDKMAKGLKQEGLELSMENMKILAQKYAGLFLQDLEKLNIKSPTELPYASEFVEQQKKLIERLEEKDFTYITSDGVYFDTSKFPNYGKLGNVQQGDESRIGENSEKKNQKDFALWKLGEDLGWDSKWGRGFPGWHIECTAMIFELLGERIDIHTGGIEHVGVHHNNEIAQAESASGKSPFSRFWLHREHIRLGDEKIAKSTGNVVYLDDLINKGIHPLSYRYWLLTSRYNTPSNFTWEAVEGAQNALEGIVLKYLASPQPLSQGEGQNQIQKFEESIADDLNTPVAIALLQEAKTKKEIEKMDQILGLNIAELAKQMGNIGEEILSLQKERDEARENSNYKLSDELREKIESIGYKINDLDKGSKIYRTLSNVIVSR